MLDPTKTIDGSFGKLLDADGNWLTNVTGVTANIAIGMEEIPVSGTRWLGHKPTTLKGSGAANGFLVTTNFIEKIMAIANDRSVPFFTELIVVLDDPAAHGAYRARLKNVTFDNIPLAGYEHGTTVKQELTFVFSGAELLDKINA
ncbi:phage tail tube protein [Paenibacillus shunpengii]|uniref:Phage tail tube protein n=1 Tax=Paenibacillus shunpengii TaxID=2054424 RepID=A0ABW5SU32_9BACL